MFGRPAYRSVFDEFARMQREMNRLSNYFGGQPARQPAAGVFPLINLTEDKDAYYVRAEIPGVTADQLDIQAIGNGLSISGERKIPAEGENVRYHRREREAGRFSRIVNLPGQIELDKIEAGFTNGVLTVKVPKAEAAKPRQITVK
jgi:HSP20 family protein